MSGSGKESNGEEGFSWWHAFDRTIVGVALGVAGWLGYVILAANPSWAELVAGRGPVPILRRSISQVTGLVPFSLLEFVVLGVLVREVGGAVKGWASVRRGEASLPGAMGRGVLQLARDAGVLLFLFYLLWGFQYARPGFEDHLGIAVEGEAGLDELRDLAEHSVRITNELYFALHGSEDAGFPTPTPDVASLVPALREGWVSARLDYDLPEAVIANFGAPKTFLSSPIVKRLGVAGMHFPYTGEALVLRDLPGIDMAQSVAHEMAHQRGFASESDANVLSFLVGRASPDPVAQYAAHAFLQRQLLTALQRVSRQAAGEVASERHPGVTRDYQSLTEYWRPAQNPVSRTANRLNDRMLRSHGIPEGVASYQGSTWVFIALARERGVGALF